MIQIICLISGLMLLICMLATILGVIVQKCVTRIVTMNERLLILVADKQSGPELVKGLIASTKISGKPLLPAELPKKEQGGLRFTMGRPK